ncbi:PAS-domain containing protein, partial [Paracraurococcus ruber]
MKPSGAADAALMAALSALPLGVWATGPDGRLAFVNDALRRATGLDAAHLLPGAPVEGLVRSLARQGFYGPGDPEALAAEQLRIDRGRPFRRRIRRADGACFDEIGAPLAGGGAVAALVEVTGLLAGTEAAAAQARRLQDLLARLHGGVAAYDQDRRVVFTNPAYEDLLGLPRGTIRPGMTHAAFYRLLAERGEFANQDSDAVVEDRLRLDRSRPHTYQRTRPNGQVLRFESQGLPEGGHLVEVTDMTAARRAEEEAQRRAGLLDGVLACLPHGVVVYGADGRATMVNAAHQAIMAGAEVAVGEHREEIASRRARQGEYGPGDPEELARRNLYRPPEAPVPRQRIRPDGTVLDIRYASLPDGGIVQVVTDITALHAARAEATARAAALQALLDKMRHGIALYGPDRRLLAVNSLAQALSGTPDPAVRPGCSLDEIVVAQRAAGVFGTGPAADAAAAEIIGFDRSQPIRYRRTMPDGRIIEIHSDPTPEGGFVISWTDVTARARAEEAAERRAAMLQVALDAMQHGFILYDRDGRLLAANAMAASCTLLPPGDLQPGRPFGDLVRAQQAAGFYGVGEAGGAAMRDALARDRGEAFETRRGLPDGRVMQERSAPTPDGGFVITLTDVTALVRAEEATRERATLLQTMQDSMRHGLALFGPEGGLVVANRLAAGLAGVPAEEMRPGMTVADLAARQLAQGVFGEGAAAEAEAAAVARRDRRQSHPVRRRMPDGRVVDSVSDPTPDGGFVVTWTDVTALAEAEARAEQRAATLQAMIDNMHHGVVLFGPDRRFLADNRLARELTGVPDAMAVPGAPLEALTGALFGRGATGDAALDATLERQAAAADRSRPLHYIRPTRDGRTLEVFSDPMPDGGFVITLSDITPLARAEAEAKRQAATQAVMLDVIRHGIMLFGPDRRLIAANRLAATLSGAPEGSLRPGTLHAEVLRGQQAAGVFGDTPGAAAEVSRLGALDRSQPIRYQRRNAAGRLIEVVSDPTPDGGFAITFSDISALAEAEAAAESRAAMLQAALDHMRHGLLIYGPDRRLKAANALAPALTGLAPVDMPAGIALEETLLRQRDRGHFGPEPGATATMQRLAALDRSQPRREMRHLTDGRQLEVYTDPTPDGGFVVSFTDVTARARAEAEARQHAAMLQAALDSMRHALILFGPDRRMILANRLAGPPHALPDLRGREGESFDELVREQWRSGQLGTGEAAEARLRELLGMDRGRSIRYRRQRPNGQVMEVGSDPTPDGGFVITHTDVTDLARAESEAASRAGILQLMLDSMRHGICYYGPDRRIIAANRLAADLGGYPPEMLAVGASLEELIACQLRRGSVGGDAEATARMARMLDRTRPARYVRPNADGRIIEVTSDPTPDGGFVVTMSDISALATAEAEAQRRAGILQAMLDNIRHGIALFDAEGRILAVNPEFLELLELPQAVMAAGGSFEGFIDHLQQRGEYGAGEEGLATAARLKARDRRQPSLSVRTRPSGLVLEIASEPVPGGGWVLALTDVTEDRRIRAELERAKDAAEAANRAKSRFLATMSHELRTPLNAVIGFSEAITADPDPVRGRDYVRSIHEAGRHLLSLIDDILDVTRAETTGFAMTEGEVAVIPLVETTVRVMQATAATAGVTVAAALPPALPLLRADEVRLRQVLLNLVSNAVKFTPAGGTVTVTAAATAEEADGPLDGPVDGGG